MLDALESRGIDPEIRTYNTGARRRLPCPVPWALGLGPHLTAAGLGQGASEQPGLCDVGAPGRRMPKALSQARGTDWYLAARPPARHHLSHAHPPGPGPATPPAAVIIACNMSGQAQEALRIYERMLAAGAQPTATTYTGARARVPCRSALRREVLGRALLLCALAHGSQTPLCHQLGCMKSHAPNPTDHPHPTHPPRSPHLRLRQERAAGQGAADLPGGWGLGAGG